MKKILVLFAIFFISASFISAAEQPNQPTTRPSVAEVKAQREKAPAKKGVTPPLFFSFDFAKRQQAKEKTCRYFQYRS